MKITREQFEGLTALVADYHKAACAINYLCASITRHQVELDASAVVLALNLREHAIDLHDRGNKLKHALSQRFELDIPGQT